MLFLSDLWCGNWGHVSDNRKLTSNHRAKYKVLLITRTRHHGYKHTQSHAHTPTHTLLPCLTVVNELWLHKDDFYRNLSLYVYFSVCFFQFACVFGFYFIIFLTLVSNFVFIDFFISFYFLFVDSLKWKYSHLTPDLRNSVYQM